jgi:hypothetical protein
MIREITALTVADLAAQLDELGWTMTAFCPRHVWHVTLTGVGAEQVTATGPDWLATVAAAIGEAHAYRARQMVRIG